MASSEDILSIKKGDEEAFRRLYDTNWPRVYGFTKIYLKDDFEREEITQKVFIKLWKIREVLNEEKSIEGLLFILTRNLIFDERRKSLDRQAVRETLRRALQIAQCESEAELEAADLSGYIDQLVDQLPPRQHETFLLSRRDGLNNKEIAALLAITEKGVERNLTEALKFIRKNLPLFILFMQQ